MSPTRRHSRFVSPVLSSITGTVTAYMLSNPPEVHSSHQLLIDWAEIYSDSLQPCCSLWIIQHRWGLAVSSLVWYAKHSYCIDEVWVSPQHCQHSECMHYAKDHTGWWYQQWYLHFLLLPSLRKWSWVAKVWPDVNHPITEPSRQDSPEIYVLYRWAWIIYAHWYIILYDPELNVSACNIVLMLFFAEDHVSCGYMLRFIVQ